MPRREREDLLSSDYIIRGIYSPTWQKVKARAALEGRPVLEVLLDFLDAYARGRPGSTVRLPRSFERRV